MHHFSSSEIWILGKEYEHADMVIQYPLKKPNSIHTMLFNFTHNQCPILKPKNKIGKKTIVL